MSTAAALDGGAAALPAPTADEGMSLRGCRVTALAGLPVVVVLTVGGSVGRGLKGRGGGSVAVDEGVAVGVGRTPTLCGSVVGWVEGDAAWNCRITAPMLLRSRGGHCPVEAGLERRVEGCGVAAWSSRAEKFSGTLGVATPVFCWPSSVAFRRALANTEVKSLMS